MSKDQCWECYMPCLSKSTQSATSHNCHWWHTRAAMHNVPIVLHWPIRLMWLCRQLCWYYFIVTTFESIVLVYPVYCSHYAEWGLWLQLVCASRCYEMLAVCVCMYGDYKAIYLSHYLHTNTYVRACIAKSMRNTKDLWYTHRHGYLCSRWTIPHASSQAGLVDIVYLCTHASTYMLCLQRGRWLFPKAEGRAWIYIWRHHHSPPWQTSILWRQDQKLLHRTSALGWRNTILFGRQRLLWC